MHQGQICESGTRVLVHEKVHDEFVDKMLAGIKRIQIDDSLSQLFRSETPEFKQYEEVSRRFPSSEFDVLLVIEGKDLLERDNLEKLRDVVTNLQLVDGVRGLVSLFSES